MGPTPNLRSETSAVSCSFISVAILPRALLPTDHIQIAIVDREGIRFVQTFGILGGVPVDPWSVHEVASCCLRLVRYAWPKYGWSTTCFEFAVRHEPCSALWAATRFSISRLFANLLPCPCLLVFANRRHSECFASFGDLRMLIATVKPVAANRLQSKWRHML